ncbi:MAG: TonB-dependent receptor [Acidobacteria bacterium]|nr:MAG: TonB-dependent receptor [Acidobacteriota bacterium]
MRPLHLLLLSTLFTLVMRGAVVAQVGATGEISGIVRDATGAVVPGAVITVTNLKTGSARSTSTNESGFYVIAGLPPGEYELRAEHEGFKTYVHPKLVLTVGQSVSLDLALEVGTIEEMLEVRAEPPLVETRKMEQSQIVSRLQVENLPINGRRFIDFTLLTPNVSLGRSYVGAASSPQLETQAVKISFAGLREFYSNNIRIDGADATTSYTGIQRLTPSQEATEEFRVLTGVYAAEYGRATGGIVNIVTKEGKNIFDGNVYYFLRNDDLDARNILRAPGFDILRQNQFGFTLGGPIIRNKAFFFTNYEGQRRAESPIYSSVILSSIEQINRVKQFFGLPPENLNVLKVNDADQFLIKGNIVRPRNTFNVKYEFAEQRNRNQPATIEGSGLPSNFRNNKIRDQSFVFNNIFVASPSITNEFLFQFAHRTFDNPAVSIGPSMQVTNLLDIGRHAGPFDFYRETRWQFSDNLSYVAGHHSLKFGLDFSHIRNKIIFPGMNPAVSIFTPESFFGLPPFGRPTAVLFLAAIPTSVRQNPLPVRDFTTLFPTPEWLTAATTRPRHNFFEVFGQDQIRATDRLTVNLGLRYSVETRPFGIVEDDFNNVQPRVGFAYSFADRAVIRGGFGLYTGPMHWSDILGTITPWGGSDFPDPRFRFTQVESQNGAMGPIPGPFTAGPAFFNLARNGLYPDVSRMAEWILIKPVRDLPNPYAEQASLQLEYQIGTHWAVSLGWLFVHGLKSVALRHINVKPIGALPNGKTMFTALNPRFGFYQVLEPSQTSLYHAGNLIVQRRFHRNVSLVVNYTFSKTIDSTSPGTSLTQIPENNLNARLDRAVSNMHVAHRFVLRLLAEGPRRFALTRDFKLGIITTLESARFYTIFVGFDANGDLQPTNDRVGLLGRNTLKGDNFSSVDLRLSRIIPFGERLKLEFIAETFNLFNTTNITEINTVYGAPDFLPGQPVPHSFRDRIQAPVASFGTPKAVSNPRQIQFALKLRF